MWRWRLLVTWGSLLTTPAADVWRARSLLIESMLLSPPSHRRDQTRVHWWMLIATTGPCVHHVTSGLLQRIANCSMAVRQRLQRIQNSAARLVCAEPAFSHPTPLLHRLHWLPVARRITYKLCVLMLDVFHEILRNELHWLSVPQRVKFKLGAMMFRCLRHSVPRYLSDFCTPVANVAAHSQLYGPPYVIVVPRYNRSTYGLRAFSVAGPMTWNSLTESLRDPSLSIDSFRRQRKTFLFYN